MKIRCKKLVDHAVVPTQAKKGDAAYDLTAVDVAYNPEYNFYEYGTGLAFEIPEGYVGLVFCRSSISKKPLRLANKVGVIDSGYRGEVTFRFKPENEDVTLEDAYGVGDRIGQLMVIKREDVEFTPVAELEDSERGDGGYGSSGF